MHKFFNEAGDLAEKNLWRYGQALFNHLLDVRPELAEEIRGTDKDPFYIETLSDPKYKNFLDFLSERWYNT
jgi:hypothetical protein